MTKNLNTQSAVRTRTSRKVYVVLPSFNEESGLGILLGRLDEVMFDAGISYRVIIVDDGSTDGTANVARDHATHMPITLVQHRVNQGLGATIRDGLAAAVAEADMRDIVVTMDADGTHTPRLIIPMVRMIEEGHDVVSASRFQPGARMIGVPLVRRFTGIGGSLLFRLFFPTSGVKEYTSGYRAYHVAALQKAMQHYGDRFVEEEGFECMADVLLKLRRMPVTFGEVPTIIRYDLKEGGTKMKVGRTILSTLLIILKRRILL